MSEILQRVRFVRDHRWAPGHMSAYLDGELASRPRGRLERHVSSCPQCRRILRGLRQMLSDMRGLSKPRGGASPTDVAAAVRARLHEPADR